VGGRQEHVTQLHDVWVVAGRQLLVDEQLTQQVLVAALIPTYTNTDSRE
jgi:hypothetical protein